MGITVSFKFYERLEVLVAQENVISLKLQLHIFETYISLEFQKIFMPAIIYA